LHREGLLGPPPTHKDLVVDLAWCATCQLRMQITCTELCRFVRAHTVSPFFACNEQRFSELTGLQRLHGSLPRPLRDGVVEVNGIERCSGW
jgi:hypothetical protein